MTRVKRKVKCNRWWIYQVAQIKEHQWSQRDHARTQNTSAKWKSMGMFWSSCVFFNVFLTLTVTFWHSTSCFSLFRQCVRLYLLLSMPWLSINGLSVLLAVVCIYSLAIVSLFSMLLIWPLIVCYIISVYAAGQNRALIFALERLRQLSALHLTARLTYSVGEVALRA